MSAERPGANPTSDPGYWDRTARRYDRAALLLNRRFPEMARRVADDLAGTDAVLEVAAGTGLVTRAVAPRVGRLVATDRSPEMRSILRARVHDVGGSVEVREADALALPFESGAFGGIVLANLLHLLPDPGRALDEARRVLRPGGMLCAPTFCHGEGLVAQSVSRLLGLARFPVISRYRAAEVFALVEQHGFVVSRREVLDGLLPLAVVTGRRRE